MEKITNLVLAEKIDTLAREFKEVKCAVKENTDFRLQTKGFLTALVMISGTLGGAAAWILGKVFR